jgi:putative phosphoesterase
MKIAVLADTHIPKRARKLPDKALTVLSDADAIIHAGDVVSEEFLQTLLSIAPLYAVLGNNDLAMSLPETLEFELSGIKFAVIHDSGASAGRAARMKKRFPDAQIVVYGHSHIPMNTVENDQLLFNPGSPTDRRQQPKHTMGILTIKDGIMESEIIDLD